MANAIKNVSTSYVLELSEKEADYLINLTQNALLMHESDEEDTNTRECRQAIFTALRPAFPPTPSIIEEPLPIPMIPEPFEEFDDDIPF
jgi:hypothetical protein